MSRTARAVEIDTRGERDSGLYEGTAAEFNRIIAEARDVAIDVEGAVNREEIAKTEPRQGLEQEGAALRVARPHLFELIGPLESRLRRSAKCRAAR